jgi:hypothetical protein
VRARDEGSADLGRIPPGYDPKAKRFFGIYVTRREILHEMLSVDRTHEAIFSAFRKVLPVWLSLTGEPAKIRQHRRNQVEVMGIGRRELVRV